MEIVRHVAVFKGLVGLIRKMEADFKAGQSKHLCFVYLPVKDI